MEQVAEPRTHRQYPLVTLVGTWAIFHGVNEIFAAFAVRQPGRQAERLLG